MDQSLIVSSNFESELAKSLNIHPTRPQSAILTRNRLQPDLVMDLPPASQQDNITPPLSSNSTSVSSSMTSLDKQVIEDVNNVVDDDADDSLGGDHFAKQNQSTLKKNEKFGNLTLEKISTTVARPAEADIKNNDEVVLRIDESNEILERNRQSTSKIDKSPIPERNTQRFVHQFADLKLTGGTSSLKSSTTFAQENSLEKSEQRSSFKPNISIKPQILTKKKSVLLHIHQPSSSKSSTEYPNIKSKTQQQ